MVEEPEQSALGAVALAGSGEYTAAMRATDAALLATCAGPGPAYVVVCPVAAGQEPPASPARWAEMGLAHFAALGARVQAAMILRRDDAQDPRWLPMLEEADFYYFSGGDPGYVVATLAGTPAWDVIRRRHQAGAVLAGCSAGAMALGDWMIGRPALGRAAYQPALGILPHVVTIPHFDRWTRFPGAPLIGLLERRAPDGTVVVGIDEDTALVRRPGVRHVPSEPAWEVQGRQTVTVFGGPDGRTVFRPGDRVPLPFT